MIVEPLDQLKEKEYLLRTSTAQWKQIESYAKKHKVKVAVAIRLMLDKVIKEEDNNGKNTNN